LLDYAQFLPQLDELTAPDGACPVHDLELEILAPFSKQPSAPYRVDLALTYRCNNNCPHCYNARPRTFPEMDTAAWKRTLDLLWSIGIPHIVFTGGEPTFRPDLPELIAHAEKLGQITGINTNGRKLKDPALVQSLVDAGLDHVQITLESHNPAIHDHMVAPHGAWDDTVAGLRNALATRLFVMTNTTLLQENAPYLSDTLDFLADLGVPTIGLNALIYSGRGSTVGTGLPESALPPLLDLARSKTEAAHQRLIWYTPTQYCNFDPVQMDLGVKGCSAALYNMCIEPDGSVLPCQSYYTSLGNILSDPWPSIWQHDLAVSLRERRNLPNECHTCALISECGGGCPLARNPIGAALPAIP
ncbi:radical SAM protein, partial [bacterium]|nr:radical SAM protein [bacterium]